MVINEKGLEAKRPRFSAHIQRQSKRNIFAEKFQPQPSKQNIYPGIKKYKDTGFLNFFYFFAEFLYYIIFWIKKIILGRVRKIKSHFLLRWRDNELGCTVSACSFDTTHFGWSLFQCLFPYLFHFCLPTKLICI